MKKQNIIIISIILFLLTLTVGYALFTEMLTITGTSSAIGEFDVKFIDPGVMPTTQGYTKKGTEEISVISLDGNTLTITVNQLDYPGAYVIVPIKVKNNSSISIILDSLNEEEFNVDEPMKISHTDISNTELNAGATTTFEVKVEWDKLDINPSRSVSSQFKLKLNYRQK